MRIGLFDLRFSASTTFRGSRQHHRTSFLLVSLSTGEPPSLLFCFSGTETTLLEASFGKDIQPTEARVHTGNKQQLTASALLQSRNHDKSFAHQRKTILARDG